MSESLPSAQTALATPRNPLLPQEPVPKNVESDYSHFGSIRPIGELNEQWLQMPEAFENVAGTDLILPCTINSEKDIYLYGGAQSVTQTVRAYEVQRRVDNPPLRMVNIQTVSGGWPAWPAQKLMMASSDEAVRLPTAFMIAGTTAPGVFEDAIGIHPSPEMGFNAIMERISESLPSELSEIKRDISASRRILSLADNWDDEGSIGYSLDTLESAISFLAYSALEIWESERILIQPPRISPGPDGSIDLHWVKNKYGLLINIEPKPSTFITFYGEENEGNYIKGRLNRGEIKRAILLFLMEQG